jgi:hypothetical protein
VDTRTWIPFSPTKLTDKAQAILLDAAARLQHASSEADNALRAVAIERLRRAEVARHATKRNPQNVRVLAAIHVLCDLGKQGWSVRQRKGVVQVGRLSNSLDPEQDRLRIRQQLHAERDEQLRQESVRAFIKTMESRRVWNGKPVSIFSLMRDGRHLAEALRSGKDAIEPILQFVSGEEICELTGFRLMDIWRYFRHTWSTPYKSVPGRTMMVIVRDKAAPFHPVIGIAALSSATVGLTVRDESIGWTFRQVANRIIADPSRKYATWMSRITDDAIDELYKKDLLADKILSLQTVKRPTPELIEELMALSRRHRKEHYRFMQGRDYKKNEPSNDASPEYWEDQARSLLFLSKREHELATLLQIRMSLDSQLGPDADGEKLVQFLRTREGRIALTKIIRKAKADRVGTVIADLTICGAIPPYGEILGGKLVAMLMASPEVTTEYQRRYRKSPSIIASSMAGKPLVRPSDLVYISTTSLYGRRPNQYDRIVVPLDRVFPGLTGSVRYDYLGRTRGLGTFQFGPETVEEMALLLARSSQGQRVNSVFGEGVNPRMRKVRDGLDELGLSSDAFLDHGAPRLVYGVQLIENLSDYLLGIAKTPRYFIKVRDMDAATRSISKWWFERWCRPRIEKQETLEQVESQTLVHPIRHSARVQLPPALTEERGLFEEV